jgi:hypothetical protein
VQEKNNKHIEAIEGKEIKGGEAEELKMHATKIHHH